MSAADANDLPYSSNACGSTSREEGMGKQALLLCGCFTNSVETAQVGGENVSEAFPFDGRVAAGQHNYGVDSR